MSLKAIISFRHAERNDAPAHELNEAQRIVCNVEFEMPHGTLISGDEKQIARLNRNDFRVWVLPEPQLLEIGQRTIDITGPMVPVDAALDIPPELDATWPQHLLQLIAPPISDWLALLEHEGIHVIALLPPYGLCIHARPDQLMFLMELPFVSWVERHRPSYRIGRSLENAEGLVRYLNVCVYPASGADTVRTALQDAGGTIMHEGVESRHVNARYSFTVEIAAEAISELARLPSVFRLEHESWSYTADDERSSQITAENVEGTPLRPKRGYQQALKDFGLSGEGVLVGICDSGVDTEHPDLKGRLAFYLDAERFTVVKPPSDDKNPKVHGTMVAGIAVGNAASGSKDPDGFLLGQGVAPNARYGVINPVDHRKVKIKPGYPVDVLVKHMAKHGVDVMNNSWRDKDIAGYTVGSEKVDVSVRDPNPDKAGLEYLVQVWSAGNFNAQIDQYSTITSPAMAKNVIVAGNSLNYRPEESYFSDMISGMHPKSCRGPSKSGQVLPTVVAPGTDIVTARPNARGAKPYVDWDGKEHKHYAIDTGTSFAAPHVSGICALLIEWWRKRNNKQSPSPAMVKALIINGAEDLAGGPRYYRVRWWDENKFNIPWSKKPTDVRLADHPFVPQTWSTLTEASDSGLGDGEWYWDDMRLDLKPDSTWATGQQLYDIGCPLSHIPNEDQGWGRASLRNIVVDAPGSDRGPKVCFDQTHLLKHEEVHKACRVEPVDSKRPMRVTLVWTDPAGSGIRNHLNLEVNEERTGGLTYRGNNFSDGYSVDGGNFDSNNNVECVYIKDPTGRYQINVIANSLSTSCRPEVQERCQDFALVIDNARSV